MPDPLKVFCTTCMGLTNHWIHRQWDYKLEDEESGYGSTTLWQIIACQGCGTGSFRTVHTDSESQDPDTGEWYETITLYPPRSYDYKGTHRFTHVPDKLEKIYKETISAFNAEMDVLCAGGLRAIVEGICADLGITDDSLRTKKVAPNLKNKIEELAHQGHLTKTHSAILHELRFLGNTALHELEPPRRKHLAKAIDIVEHTLDSVYEVEVMGFELQRHRELKEKQNQSKKGSS